MMDDRRAFELSRLYIQERIAAAEREHLLREFGQRRAYFSEFAARAGNLLVRVGRRLEAIGGAAQTGPSLEMQQGAI